MQGIKACDWVENIFYNEARNVHDYHMSDIRNLLLTLDLDLSTIDIDKLTTMRCDGYMRCERRRYN